MQISIYCSGGIQKNTSEKDKICWTQAERDILAQSLYPNEVRFLNPDDPLEDLSDSLAVFGRDMFQIQFADFVVVDARQRRGIGIGTEMVVSKIFGTPLVVIAPAEGHYRKAELFYRGALVKNYIHPHLEAFADAIVEDFANAGLWIKQQIEAPKRVKDTKIIAESIEKYKNRILPTDAFMQIILKEKEKQ